MRLLLVAGVIPALVQQGCGDKEVIPPVGRVSAVKGTPKKASVRAQPVGPDDQGDRVSANHHEVLRQTEANTAAHAIAVHEAEGVLVSPHQAERLVEAMALATTAESCIQEQVAAIVKLTEVEGVSLSVCAAKVDAAHAAVVGGPISAMHRVAVLRMQMAIDLKPLLTALRRYRIRFVTDMMTRIEAGVLGSDLSARAVDYVRSTVARLRELDHAELIEGELTRWNGSVWAVVDDVADADVVGSMGYTSGEVEPTTADPLAELNACVAGIGSWLRTKMSQAVSEADVRETVESGVGRCAPEVGAIGSSIAAGNGDLRSGLIDIWRRHTELRSALGMALLNAHREFVRQRPSLQDLAGAQAAVRRLTDPIRQLPGCDPVFLGELNRWAREPFTIRSGKLERGQAVLACIDRERAIVARKWTSIVSLQQTEADILESVQRCTRVGMDSEQTEPESMRFPETWYRAAAEAGFSIARTQVSEFLRLQSALIATADTGASATVRDELRSLRSGPGSEFVVRAVNGLVGPAVRAESVVSLQAGKDADKVELLHLVHTREIESYFTDRGSCPPDRLSIDGGVAIQLKPGPGMAGSSTSVRITTDERFVVKSLLLEKRDGTADLLFDALSKERGVHESLGDFGGLSVKLHTVDAGQLLPGCEAAVTVTDFAGIHNLHALEASATHSQIAAIGAKGIRILKEVHAHGIVHGDVNKGNFVFENILDPSATLRIIDFGRAERFLSFDGTHVPGARGEREQMLNAALLSPWELEGYTVSRRDDLFRLSETLLRLAGIDPVGLGAIDLSEDAEIARAKRREPPGPRTLREFHQATLQLGFEANPDYDTWIERFTDAAARNSLD